MRAVRIRRRWRQSDLARAAGVSQSTVSRLERGHLGTLSLDALRAVAAALDMRIDLVARWRGGELDRLLNARHSAMHESVARMFATLPGWVAVPEVSFSVRGERGIVDVLAWHAASRSLLVVELKTELVDVQEVLGTLDRKRRLAPLIGHERGWDARQVGAWLLFSESTMNRERVRAHASVLRAACPAGGPEIRRWLHQPAGVIRALSFLGTGFAGGGWGAPGGDPRVREREPLSGAGPRDGLAAGSPGRASRTLGTSHGRTATSALAARKRVRLPKGASGTRPGP